MKCLKVVVCSLVVSMFFSFSTHVEAGGMGKLALKGGSKIFRGGSKVFKEAKKVPPAVTSDIFAQALYDSMRNLSDNQQEGSYGDYQMEQHIQQRQQYVRQQQQLQQMQQQQYMRQQKYMQQKQLEQIYQAQRLNQFYLNRYVLHGY